MLSRNPRRVKVSAWNQRIVNIVTKNLKWVKVLATISSRTQDLDKRIVKIKILSRNHRGNKISTRKAWKQNLGEKPKKTQVFKKKAGKNKIIEKSGTRAEFRLKSGYWHKLQKKTKYFQEIQEESKPRQKFQEKLRP